jgi:hypothetical protein
MEAVTSASVSHKGASLIIGILIVAGNFGLSF